MGEAAPCLIRSLSQSSDSSSQPREEDDPLRALKTSISFGRFVSDTSSWEKWSCFSNKRYLEEAERISKPGSVAEKKALLEAHFKKISSNKANNGTNHHEPQNVDNSRSDSLMVISVVEMQEKEEANVLDVVEIKELDMDKKENMEPETKITDIVEKVIPCQVPKPPTIKGKHVKCASSKQEKLFDITDQANSRNLVSSINKNKQALNTRSLSKLRFSIKLVRSEPSKNDNTAQITKNSETGPSEKMRSNLRSLHMSVDHSSCFNENSKRSMPVIQKTEDPKDFRNFSKISRASTSHQTSTRALVAGALVQPSATVQLEKRIKTRDKPLVPRSNENFQSLIIEAKTRKQNTQSSNVAPSPFSLRCEGRVAKRKEFFQKLEEKQKAKEAEKLHIQTKSKKKSDNNLKMMQKSTNCSWKLSANSHLETELPNSRTNKILSTQPIWVPQKINDATKRKEKSIRTPTRSSCAISRNNLKENASPNIQRWL